MLVRTFDATALNLVANDAAVRPWIGGEGPVDFTATLSDRSNVALALVSGGGGFLGIRIAPGIYDVHSLFVPDARRYTLSAMREALRFMFVDLDARELVTTVPDGNRAAAALTQRAGFTCAGFRAACWPVMGGPLGVTWWRMTLVDWCQKNDTLCQTVVAQGER